MVHSNKATVAKMCTAYSKSLHRLLLYKLDSFQYSASKIFVANNVDFLDVLIKKSTHGYFTCFVTCDNNIINCQTAFFSMQVLS